MMKDRADRRPLFNPGSPLYAPVTFSIRRNRMITRAGPGGPNCRWLAIDADPG
jgi:hypothetical protein